MQEKREEFLNKYGKFSKNLGRLQDELMDIDDYDEELYQLIEKTIDRYDELQEEFEESVHE